jgi:DNA repair exonuclease SbcCD ATPase subunit
MRIVAALLFLGAVRGSQLNPMSRVADLLTNLVKKKESDMKAETDLWDRYVCWYKTVVTTKKASNSNARTRIESLEAYIKDIEGGKVEFTNERETLVKEVKALSDEIDTATELRQKENEDFEAAKDEMEKAIASLEKAVEVLGEATKDMKEGVLMSMNSQLNFALHVGETFLSKDDSAVLQSALNGEEEPEGFAGMLGKDKKFNEKYKKRSSKIQEILADMLQTFKDNLDDAKKKESETKTSFDTLMGSKQSQLKSAEGAQASKNEEMGARNLNKAEAQDEVDMLKTRVENDEKFVGQAESDYKTKSDEWKERQRLRNAEMASITEALAVLRSDDARDLAKKSMASQTAFFLQTESKATKCSKHRAGKAIDILKQGAEKHRDLRLQVLASMLQWQSNKGDKRFKKVEKAVDKMIEDLHAEEDEDLEVKENCEKDRMKNTKVAKKKSQEIDDKTSFISRRNSEIATLKTKIANLVKNIQDLHNQIAQAKSMRDAENAEFKVAKGDDVAAKGLIEKTKTVLMKFYEDEGLALTQTRSKSQATVDQAPEMSPAGEAPLPPPQMWSEPYGGSPGEANGIQSILEMIMDDIDKDIRTATAEEDTSQGEFDSYKSTTESTIGKLEDQKAEFETDMGDKEGEIEVAKGERADKKNILDQTMAYLKTIAPGCDYMAVNFELRKQNRAEEIEGLAEAKASLSGGDFGFLQKPGDDSC